MTQRLMIMVAGSYSAPTMDQRQSNLTALMETAQRIYARGHVPVVGVKVALDFIEHDPEQYNENIRQQIMRVSLLLAERCDGILCIGNSPGAKQEVDLIQRRNGLIFDSVERIPFINSGIL